MASAICEAIGHREKGEVAAIRGRLTPVDQDVLYHLVIGSHRLIIARKLHVSPQTADLRIADLNSLGRWPTRRAGLRRRL